MRSILLSALFIIHFSFGTYAQETKFPQDIAVIHGNTQGLPQGNIQHISITNNTPTATTSSGQYEW